MTQPSSRRYTGGSLILFAIAASLLSCVEGGSLAISAGAPAAAAVEGRITECGRALAGAEIVLRVQQDRPEQARPVDVEIGPVTTTRDGRYIVEVAPSFAVPGRARLELQSVNGTTLELAGPDLGFALGVPPRDTMRFDADVGAHRGSCR
jgi:hypothetical protein